MGVLTAVAAAIALLAAGSVPLLRGDFGGRGNGGAAAGHAGTTRADVQPAFQVIGQQSGMCMEAMGARQRTDRPVQLGTCNAGHSRQRWTFPGDGTVRTDGLCLAAKADATTNGTIMVASVCRPGVASQKFRFEDAADLVNVRADACVDATGNATSEGTQLQLWTCAGALNQKWRRYPIGKS